MSTAMFGRRSTRRVAVVLPTGLLVLAVLAAVALTDDRPDEALAHAAAAVEVQRSTGHRLGEARALRLLGRALAAAGRAGEAGDREAAAAAILAELGVPDGAGGPPG